jgi:GntR family transcriptional regulator, transcriptional repressor for pyruvate dehydrogenase complex
VLRLPRADNPFPYIVLTAPQQVAAAIKREILEGGLKPGDRLPPEQELAHLFSVSRPTVRSGLQELCAAQILVVQRGRNGGYRVGDFSLDSLEASVMEFISLSLVVETLKPEQFLEVRFAHELLCAETAARRRTAASLAKLEQIHTQIEEAYGESRRAFELDLQFHRALAEATQNPLILSIEGALIAVLHRMIGDATQTTPAETLANLNEIFNAVRDGRPDAAREAMRRHLSQTAIHYGFESNGARAGASWIAVAR